jgi:hypothetical protein
MAALFGVGERSPGGEGNAYDQRHKLGQTRLHLSGSPGKSCRAASKAYR